MSDLERLTLVRQRPPDAPSPLSDHPAPHSPLLPPPRTARPLPLASAPSITPSGAPARMHLFEGRPRAAELPPRAAPPAPRSRRSSEEQREGGLDVRESAAASGERLERRLVLKRAQLTVEHQRPRALACLF